MRRGASRSRVPTRGSPRRTTNGSPRPTTTASTCFPRRSATSRATRALPGAHAVQGSDRARHARARRRARRVRQESEPRRSGARCADEGIVCAERVRVGVPRARAHRRRRADRARRSRQAVVQDGARAASRGLVGARAHGEGDARAKRVQGAREGVGDDRGAPSRRHGAARRAAKSRSRRSTKGCSSSCRTIRGSSSTR